MTHPYWEFVEHGYRVDIASPDGGELFRDSYSDPNDPSGYSEYDLISMGFMHSPEPMEKLRNSLKMSDVNTEDYDVIFLVGGMGPMVTFYSDASVHRFVSNFFEAGKITAIVCHATCILLKVTLSTGRLLVTDRTWTGFANSEEAYGEAYAKTKLQPF